MAKPSNNSLKENLFIGVIVAIVVAALGWSVLSLNKKTGQHGLRGILVEKQFIPLKETQISIGSKGVKKREKDGEYRFTVRMEETGREYYLWVDRDAYRQYKVGDEYFFLRPPTPPAEDTTTPP